MDTLGEIRDYFDMQAIIRDRAAAFQVTREGLDDVAGIPNGYAAKLLAPYPIRFLGPKTMGPVLEALGLKLIAVEDPEAVSKHANKIARHRAERSIVNEPPVTPEMQAIIQKRMHRERSRAGKKGARARMKATTREQRSTAASIAVRARWAAMGKTARQEMIEKLNRARRAKRKAPSSRTGGR
jgi:hypothetical protein